jgi:hypothetical protein
MGIGGRICEHAFVALGVAGRFSVVVASNIKLIKACAFLRLGAATSKTNARILKIEFSLGTINARSECSSCLCVASSWKRLNASEFPRSIFPYPLHPPENIEPLYRQIVKDVDKYPVLGKLSILFAVQIDDTHFRGPWSFGHAKIAARIKKG